jgi:hypothetical protein
MRRLILAIATLLGCCTPALAPAQEAFAEGPAFVTWADCSWPAPKVFLDEALDTSAWRPVWVAHAEDHVRQAVAAGCEASHSAMQDPKLRISGEASAFCAGLRVALRLHLIPSMDEAITQAAAILTEGGDIEPKAANEILRHSCSGGTAPP